MMWLWSSSSRPAGRSLGRPACAFQSSQSFLRVLQTNSVCRASPLASVTGLVFSSDGAATTNSSSSRNGWACTAGGQPSTLRRMAMSKASGALSGGSSVVKSCGSIPGWRATKSGSRGSIQRTMKDGRALIRTTRDGARTISDCAAAPICSIAGLVST